jgi:MFS family permease
VQSVRQWSPLETALAFLPAALIVAVGSPRTGAIVDRLGTAPVIAAGVAAHLAAYLLFLRVDEHSGYATSILPSMLLLGIGFMLAFPALNIQATDGIADSEQGLAGGLLNTSVQLGGAIVLAVVTAVVTANGGAQASASALLAGFKPALTVIAGISVLGIATAAIGLALHRRRTAAPAPVEERPEPEPLASEAA